MGVSVRMAIHMRAVAVVVVWFCLRPARRASCSWTQFFLLSVVDLPYDRGSQRVHVCMSSKIGSPVWANLSASTLAVLKT